MNPNSPEVVTQGEGLLPCPMCDAPARFVWGRDDTGSVKCTRPSCGTRGGDFAHKTNAITAWNTRHTPDREAMARAVFRVLHPHQSWDDFESRKTMRGSYHPMQIQALEVADAIIAMIEGGGA